MKRLIVLLVLQAGWLHAASFAFVQSKSLLNSATVTYTSNVAAGDVLILFYAGFNVSTPTGVSDSRSSAWSPFSCYQTGSASARLCATVAVAAASGSDTITVTGGTVSTNQALVALEYSAPPTYLLAFGQVCISTGGVNGCGSPTSQLTVTQNGILASGTEMLVVMGLEDQSSVHAWTSSNGGTFRDGQTSVNVGVTDNDKTVGMSPGSPFTDTYSGFSSSTGLIGLPILLIQGAGQHASGSVQ